MRTICACRVCRRTIRDDIATMFRARRRFMGFWTVRFHAHLGWVPVGDYRTIFQEMIALGLLTEIRDPEAEYPVYILSRITLPANLRKRGGA